MTEPAGIEKTLIDKVNVHSSGPTEGDEMAVLASLYFYNSETGVFFSSRYGD